MVAQYNKILIIDDEVEVGNLIECYLDPVKFMVHKELNGLAGVEILTKIDPDLIILDMKMPTLNGVEFLEYLKNQKLKYPVIAITGADKYILQSIYDLGVKTIIGKPFDEEELLSSISLELSMAQQRKLYLER